MCNHPGTYVVVCKCLKKIAKTVKSVECPIQPIMFKTKQCKELIYVGGK